MKLRTYDCGYGLALLVGPQPSKCYRVHLPFPVTFKSWKFLIRRFFHVRPMR